MALRSLYAGIGLLGLLNSAAIASIFNDSVEAANIKTVEATEPVFTCETSFPLLSLRWGDGDNTKASEIASAFLDVDRTPFAGRELTNWLNATQSVPRRMPQGRHDLSGRRHLPTTLRSRFHQSRDLGGLDR
jgi:hypothetical protein